MTIKDVEVIGNDSMLTDGGAVKEGQLKIVKKVQRALRACDYSYCAGHDVELEYHSGRKSGVVTAGMSCCGRSVRPWCC